MYARTLNSYLSWLHAEGRCPDRLRIKLLRNPPKPYLTFSDADLRRLIAHRPTRWAELRAWTMAILLLDTGIRITEALTLRREDVDLDGLTIRVLGKGRRVRLVPFSTHCRRRPGTWWRSVIWTF
jgi:integrase/recombinase XerD